MTGKERILAAMSGHSTDVVPVGVDYLTLYLAERVERAYVNAYWERLQREGRVQIDPDEDVEVRAKAILQAHACLNEPQDWFQVIGGPGRETLRRRELTLEGGRVFEVDRAAGTRRQMLLAGEASKTEEMRGLFARMHSAAEARNELNRLFEEYQADNKASRGDMRLVETLCHQLGDDYFVYTGAAAPFWSLYDLLGFEEMMTALCDMPEVMCAMMDRFLEATLSSLHDYKAAGCHGVRVEECFASADIISPSMYERFVHPYEERFFTGIRYLGLKSILYFCGDVTPRLPAIRRLPIDALMVEESKKDFTIEIGAVREAVGEDLCLFGNIDVYEVLLKGSAEALEAEIARQIAAAGAKGRFIVGVGSPVTLDTPPERIDMLARLARRQPPPLSIT